MKDDRQERRVTIGQTPRLLEGLLGTPTEPVKAGVVICHPHPEYGGNMNNSVVVAVTQAHLDAGFSTLRFNFGGVEGSQGVHTRDEMEVDDVSAAVAMLAAHLPEGAPRILIGYSYGAWMALSAAPTIPGIQRLIAIAPPLDLFEWSSLGPLPELVGIIAAEKDQFCAPDRLDTVLREQGDRIELLATIPGADHFFFGTERDVAEACLMATR